MHPVYFLSHYSSTYDDNNSIKSFIYNKYIHHTLSFLNFFLSFLNTTILILLGQQPVDSTHFMLPYFMFPY